MSKYIDADVVKNDILTLWDWGTVDGIKSSTVLKQVLSDIDNIDETIVRCRDCIHYDDCFCREDDFCSHGERKETE